MVVLGIDPGYAIVGYGAIEQVRSQSRVLGYGAITTKAGVPLPDRLSEIYHDMLELLDRVKPDAAAIEELFFNTNVTTGIAVAQARGVIVLACAQSGVPVFQYTPSAGQNGGGRLWPRRKKAGHGNDAHHAGP